MRKRIAFSVSIVFIAAAIFAMLFFALSGKGSAEADAVNLSGTWEVAASVENGKAALAEDEFMVFEAEMAYAYREGSSEPYASSKYEVHSGKELTLRLPDISRQYVIDLKSENYICLYENPESHIRLIRYPDEERKAVKVERSFIVGKWEVVYRNAAEKIDEVLEFGNSELADYRAGSDVPYATSPYSWVGGKCFHAGQLGKTMEVHPLSEDVMILVETDTAEVWELQRVNGRTAGNDG